MSNNVALRDKPSIQSTRRTVMCVYQKNAQMGKINAKMSLGMIKSHNVRIIIKRAGVMKACVMVQR